MRWIEVVFVKTQNYEVKRIAFWYVRLFPTCYQFPVRFLLVCLLTLTTIKQLLKDLLQDLFCHKEYFWCLSFKRLQITEYTFHVLCIQKLSVVKESFIISEISSKITLKVKRTVCIYLKVSLELISNKCQGIILALCNHFLSKRHHQHPAYEYGRNLLMSLVRMPVISVKMQNVTGDNHLFYKKNHLFLCYAGDDSNVDSELRYPHYMKLLNQHSCNARYDAVIVTIMCYRNYPNQEKKVCFLPQ